MSRLLGFEVNKRLKSLDASAAETIAIAALAFLAEEPARLGKFLALTGVGPAELREQAHKPHMLAAVLEHVLQDESMLLTFAANAGLSPDAISPAYEILNLVQSKGSHP